MRILGPSCLGFRVQDLRVRGIRVQGVGFGV